MKRRQFMKLASAAGLLPTISTMSQAAGSAPTKFFVYYHTSGGWDATSLLDPKGDEARGDNRGETSIVNRFTKEQILKRGNISYSPLWINNNYVDDINVGVVDPEEDLMVKISDEAFTLQTLNNAISTDTATRNSAQEGLYNAFFAKYHQKMRVLNGVNHQTNSHDTGRRYATSGITSTGQPNLSALYSASAAPDASMTYITDGQGYSETGGIVSESRMDDVNNFNYLTDTNKIDENNNFFPDDIREMIDNARNESHDRFVQQQKMAAVSNRLNLIEKAKGSNELDILMDALRVGDRVVATGLNNAQRQMSIAAAAFSKGISASCHISSRGGFDSHSNNDNTQSNSLRGVLSDIHHLWSQLEAFGVADQTTLLIGSDFGRTPWYNANNGKDHWNVSSMLLMGAGIEGNSQVQASDRLVNGLKVDPTTMEPSESGVDLTPALVHKALRFYFDIDQHEHAQSYPLDAPLSRVLG